MCVSLLSGQMRFFVRNTGSAAARLRVRVIYGGGGTGALLGGLGSTLGLTDVRTIAAGSAWQPSPVGLYARRRGAAVHDLRAVPLRAGRRIRRLADRRRLPRSAEASLAPRAHDAGPTRPGRLAPFDDLHPIVVREQYAGRLTVEPMAPCQRGRSCLARAGRCRVFTWPARIAGASTIPMRRSSSTVWSSMWSKSATTPLAGSCSRPDLAGRRTSGPS